MGAHLLGYMLERNDTLTELNLYDNPIRPTGLQALDSALKSNSRLTVLNLECNV